MTIVDDLGIIVDVLGVIAPESEILDAVQSRIISCFVGSSINGPGPHQPAIEARGRLGDRSRRAAAQRKLMFLT